MLITQIMYPDMQINISNNDKVASKELIKSEPYVIYTGFELGKYPKVEALKELRYALESFYQVVILVEDSNFSNELISFIQKGETKDGEDLSIYQKANMLVESNLVSSLPKEINHPALLHIRDTFEQDINQRVAPRLVKSQAQSWGLEHKRIKVFSKTKLETEVD